MRQMMGGGKKLVNDWEGAEETGQFKIIN